MLAGMFLPARKSSRLGVLSNGARHIDANLCAYVASAGLPKSSEKTVEPAGSTKSGALKTIASLSDLVLFHSEGSSCRALRASVREMSENLSIVGPKRVFQPSLGMLEIGLAQFRASNIANFLHEHAIVVD